MNKNKGNDMQTRRDRRLKIAMLPEHELISILNWQRASDDSMLRIRPISVGLPDDAIVTHIHHDYAFAAMAIAIHSSEFDLVPDGCMIERFDRPLELERVEFKDKSLARKEVLQALKVVMTPQFAISDTIWVDRGGIGDSGLTLADLLTSVAKRLGASDVEIQEACMQYPMS